MTEAIAIGALLLSAWTSWLAFRNRSDVFVTKLYEYQLSEAAALWESISSTMSALNTLAEAALAGSEEAHRAALDIAAKETLRETRRRSLKFAPFFSPETMAAFHQWNLESGRALTLMANPPASPAQRQVLSKPLMDSHVRLILEFQRYFHVPELRARLRKTIALTEGSLQELHAEVAGSLSGKDTAV